MRRRRGGSKEENIDISPLIDMVFILLIFFMVSTTFVKDMKLDLQRPNASSSTRASSKAIRVFIDAQGAVYVDGISVKPWMLQSRVRDLSSGAASGVLVVVDRGVASERLIEVVDQCRLAGVGDVAVATEQEVGG